MARQDMRLLPKFYVYNQYLICPKGVSIIALVKLMNSHLKQLR